MRKEDTKDSKKSFFRASDRMLKLSEAWYFGTREGDQGPFRTHDRAVREISRYVAERQDLRTFQKAREDHRPRLPFGLVVEDSELELLPLDEAESNLG